MSKINIDLQRERAKCTFNIEELTIFMDGGHQNTKERRESENVIIKHFAKFNDVPDYYMSHKEKYEDSVKKSAVLFSVVRQMQDDGKTDLKNYRDVVPHLLRLSTLRDGSPLALHYVMFMPAILNQGDEKQVEQWLPKSWNSRIIGSYAQTELGHGTFIRGLETTATYDPNTQEFVLNSPTVTSYKWWPGGLGQSANYSIVIAQLYTKGKCHGVHTFIVQLRDEETHIPLPGIEVGDIGAKMGLNPVNNGFLGFDNVRIPRRNMLMKHAKVLEDGTYVQSSNSKLNYGAMVFVRVVIVFDVVSHLRKAVTIAIRYSAVRRQSQRKPDEPESQVLDYLTQQHKLFVAIAACHAMRLTATKLWDTFTVINEQLLGGNFDRLPELHSLACCLKAIVTSDTASFVERCRLACGGHGFMMSSNLPSLYAQATAACTYEGENTVLLLQTARFLVKSWQQVDNGNLYPTVQYLADVRQDVYKTWQNSVECIVRGFQIVSMRKISMCVSNMEQKVASGMSFEDAWNITSVQLVDAAESHCRAIILSTFCEEVKKAAHTLSPELHIVLKQLLELYCAYWALQRLSDLLQHASISSKDAESLQIWYEDILLKLRPNAVGLVDAFDVRDEMLLSTLGAYDGQVYERLMEEARKNPLNQETVNSTFHEYLKPFMRGKL